MYARCPHCETVFAISAAHLRAALGHVQCGRCTRVFDALPYLIDSPREVPIYPAPAPPLADAELDADVDSQIDGELEGEPYGAESAGRDSLDGAAARPIPAPRDATPGQTPRAVPAALLEDLARPEPETASRRRGLAALALAVILLLTIVLQYAWFSPSDLVSRYPQASGFVDGLCALTGCDLGDGRDPGSIRVISRTVRVHPRYEGALRVRAVVVNTASRAQPYPHVRFTLFNVNGETIGSRVFAPREYLGARPPAGEQLASRRPLQIALELIAPEEVAVSYEFKFL